MIGYERIRSQCAIKEKLVGITKESLPSPVGDLYTGVVLACICCLDESGENLFLGEKGVVDRDGIVVGVRYI
jgi:hypothetical protein